MAEAFATALSIAAWDRAEFHLRHAQAIGLAPALWRLHEAHWLLAQHQWPEARVVLESLLEATGAAAPERLTIVHDLAYINLREGQYDAGLARLGPYVEPAMGEGEIAAAPAPLQVLWLRLLHGGGHLARAIEWLRARETNGSIDAPVAGVASLIALDEGDFEASLRWAEASLRDASPPVEALVARASLALAEQKAPLARQLLARALQANPADGRTWSAMGFAELLDQHLGPARAAFERAVQAMPDHIGTWHGLGWTAIAQRELGAARAAFEAALELDRNFAESHGGAAVVSAMAGRPDDAKTEIARALGLDRACLSARYAEALLAGDARDVDAVVRLGERLLGGRSGPLGGDLMGMLRQVRPRQR